MWVQASLQVGNQWVDLSVECLTDDERERTAALLAWSTLEAWRNIGGGTVAWQQLINELLSRHVQFTIAGAEPEQLGPAWWTEALGCALSQFVRQNDLARHVNRHLEAIRALDCSSRVES